MFSGPASRCVRSLGNRARPDDSDRKAGLGVARTFAMKRAVRGARESLAHPSARPLCRRWIDLFSHDNDKRGILLLQRGRAEGCANDSLAPRTATFIVNVLPLPTPAFQLPPPRPSRFPR